MQGKALPHAGPALPSFRHTREASCPEIPAQLRLLVPAPLRLHGCSACSYSRPIMPSVFPGQPQLAAECPARRLKMGASRICGTRALSQGMQTARTPCRHHVAAGQGWAVSAESRILLMLLGNAQAVLSLCAAQQQHQGSDSVHPAPALGVGRVRLCSPAPRSAKPLCALLKAVGYAVQGQTIESPAETLPTRNAP